MSYRIYDYFSMPTFQIFFYCRHREFGEFNKHFYCFFLNSKCKSIKTTRSLEKDWHKTLKNIKSAAIGKSKHVGVEKIYLKKAEDQ